MTNIPDYAIALLASIDIITLSYFIWQERKSHERK